MDVQSAVEILAAALSACVSVMVLAGAFAAHKKGFFRAIHRLALHHHEMIEKEKEAAKLRERGLS